MATIISYEVYLTGAAFYANRELLFKLYHVGTIILIKIFKIGN